jgi:uroporphyrin-III C-methyltransferase / precorrin-2 dehydrogenase / sirohydrochlorin ferrochelatase
MSLLPLFLKLDNRPALLVGAGKVALEKTASLLTTGVRLHVVAPQACAEMRALAAEGKLTWTERAFEAADLDGAFVVIAATDNAEVNAEIYRLATERGILCNSVDDPPHCDFYFGSVVRRGELQIAISTAGESPAVAQRLRREIDEQLPHDLGPWLAELGALRREVLAAHPAGEARKALLHELAHRQICDSPLCTTRQLAQKPTARGKVYLVGAGPGDPDLLTVKAVRLIQSAQVILHDDLVTPEILALAAPSAEILHVGKRCGTKNITQEEIDALMIDRAQQGLSVVRLKSGDPLVFGRAAEEIASLAAADVIYEVVPGITAAFAAAASLGCSLTSRHAASNLIFSTGHHAQSHNDAPLPSREDATRVVYMPGRDLSLLALEWLNEGLPADLPCALVSYAGRPEQQVVHSTLGQLGSLPPVLAPSLLVAGWALRCSTAQAQSPTETFAAAQ